jgi:hypothetical protein
MSVTVDDMRTAIAVLEELLQRGQLERTSEARALGTTLGVLQRMLRSTPGL